MLLDQWHSACVMARIQTYAYWLASQEGKQWIPVCIYIYIYTHTHTF